MEERKVRITLKIKGENELKISTEISEREALKIFDELRKNCNEAVVKENKSIQQQVVNKKVQLKDCTKEQKNKSQVVTIKQRMLEIISTKPFFTTQELFKQLDVKSPSIIYNYLVRLVKEGRIVRKQRGVYYYVNNDKNNESGDVSEVETKPPEVVEVEAKPSEEAEHEIFTKFLNNERYLEVLEYIMSKKSFKVEHIRKKLYEHEQIIPEVIKALDEKKLILYDSEAENYEIPLATRIWYTLLKSSKPIQDMTIAYSLKVQLDKNFIQTLRKAISLGLIEEKVTKKCIYYTAKLR